MLSHFIKTLINAIAFLYEGFASQFNNYRFLRSQWRVWCNSRNKCRPVSLDYF